MTCKRSQIRVLSSPPKTLRIAKSLRAIERDIWGFFSFCRRAEFADMAELADARDLESREQSCEFKSHYPHHQRAIKKILPRKALKNQGFSHFYSPFFGGAIL